MVNQRGQRLTRQGFWLIMKGLVREAGLPAIMTPHMLRHSFATHQIGEGLAWKSCANCSATPASPRPRSTPSWQRRQPEPSR